MHDIPPTLAIDFGTQRIGLARSYGTLAEPWMIINRADFIDEQAIIDKLLELIEVEGLQQVVVGVSENAMAEQTLEFVEQLRQQLTIPIHTMDETLSSQVVEGKLRQAGKVRGDRRVQIDHFAAAEVLQEWLDSQE